jgi:hypothetical protein
MQTRRSFIKRGLVGSALLALGGGSGLLLRSSKLVDPPAEGLKVLGKKEYAVLDAVSRRILPARPGFPTVDETRIAFTCDRVLAMTDETSQVEMRQLLELFENALAGFIFGGRITPFTKLDGEAQDKVLHEWATSSIAIRRTGFLAIRALVTSAYYGNPLTWSAVGYGGPPKAFHDANAPVWKGGGEPRPPGNGVWVEPT